MLAGVGDHELVELGQAEDHDPVAYGQAVAAIAVRDRLETAQLVGEFDLHHPLDVLLALDAAVEGADLDSIIVRITLARYEDVSLVIGQGAGAVVAGQEHASPEAGIETVKPTALAIQPDKFIARLARARTDEQAGAVGLALGCAEFLGEAR